MTQIVKHIGYVDPTAHRIPIAKRPASGDADRLFQATIGRWRDQVACPNRGACLGKCQALNRLFREQPGG